MSQLPGDAHSHHAPASSESHATPAADPISYAPVTRRRSTLFQVGAGLGIAAFCIGLLIFLAACFGFGAALVLSPLPVIMGLVGFVLTIVGGVRDPHTEGPAVAASLFINVGAIVGGLLTFAAWMGWRIFS